MTTDQLKDNIPLAIFYSLAGSFLCTLMLSMAKVSMVTCSTSQTILGRSLTAFFCCLVMIALQKKGQSYLSYLKTSHLKLQLIRSGASLTTVYLFIFALRMSSLTEVCLFSNTVPFFVPFVAYIWSKSPISHRIWPGIALGFLGIICIIQPESASLLGSCLVLLGAAAAAVTAVMLRLTNQTEPLYRTIFYYTFLSSLVAGALSLFEQASWAFLSSPKVLLSLLAVGFIGFLSQICIALSLKYARAQFIVPFTYSSTVFGILLDAIFWHKQLTSSEFLGILLVIGGLYLTHMLFKPKPQSSTD